MQDGSSAADQHSILTRWVIPELLPLRRHRCCSSSVTHGLRVAGHTGGRPRPGADLHHPPPATQPFTMDTPFHCPAGAGRLRTAVGTPLPPPPPPFRPPFPPPPPPLRFTPPSRPAAPRGPGRTETPRPHRGGSRGVGGREGDFGRPRRNRGRRTTTGRVGEQVAGRGGGVRSPNGPLSAPGAPERRARSRGGR